MLTYVGGRCTIGPMLQFHENDNAFTFIRNEHAIAIGEYSEEGFVLLYDEQIHTFSNAMQAFTHLRSTIEPFTPSPNTMRMFTTPSRAVDNMSKYRDNEILKDIPREVFYAYPGSK